MSIASDVRLIAEMARKASLQMATIDSRSKNNALLTMADLIESNGSYIEEENSKDIAYAVSKGFSKAMIDRLQVDDKVLSGMANGLREVSVLPDPVGAIASIRRRPNGLLVGRMSIPIGVVGIIYESRPNVTADAAGLCLKSGNAVILRGGSEAIHSNLAIIDLLKRALIKEGLPGHAVQIIPITDREAVNAMLLQEQYIDLIIPRGGEGLIRFVAENSRIPVIKHYKGVCHVYVDQFADLKMAENICLNAKVQRPGVCNAMETMLVHADVAAEFLPRMGDVFGKMDVDLRGCSKTEGFLPGILTATDADWSCEYLDLVLAVKVVEDMTEAIAHIAEYGSLHTEAIVTNDYANAQRFLREVNSSTVLVNASTRFSDGFELGLGAEIGISTTKIHSFGPMGLEDLTTRKFIVYGEGQIRG